jgi:hypothetical protein
MKCLAALFVLFLRRGPAAGVLLAGVASMNAAYADDARDLLKAMSDYMSKQQNFSLTFQSTVEAVTNDFQKLQFVSSGKLSVSRPDKIRVSRTGGFADLEVVFDGTKLTVYGKNLNAYTEVEATGSLDDLHNRLMDAGVETPGGDLLTSNVFEGLMADVTDAKHIASAYVDGVECEYLAFRTPETDWQIWIETGDRPIPRRYVITSKHTVQAPEYTFEIRDFKTGPDAGEANFTFEKPASAKKVDLSQLELIDEFPAPANAAGGQ